MGLSSDLISQFVKVTNDNKKETKKETTVYATIVKDDGKTYAKIDGSDLLTPVSSTADTKDGERVTVMIKNHTAVVTGNISSPAARTEDVKNVTDDTAEHASKISEFEIAIGYKADVEELNAANARIDELQTDNVTIKQNLAANDASIKTLEAGNVTINEHLSAAEADIDSLQTSKLDADVATATYATIESLEATDAQINNLEATYGDFEVLTSNKFEALEAEIAKLEAGEITVEQLKATFATIAQLEVEQGRITDLEAEVGDIDTLIFGSATGSTIQTSFANAVIAQLGNAQIKSAMIESITADKITSGDVITNNVRVMSEDGKLLISDETIQISDSSRVRVQIGKDSAGDYSINIWDADGNLMFSEGGITDSAIKDAIIRNDMVSDTANIAAHKLDIDSLFEEINGSTKTINSTRVYLDEEGQSLDVAFKSLSTDVDELQNEVSSQGTEISVVQGQISSKIWQQDIDAVAIGGRNLLLDTDFGDDPKHIERPEGDAKTEFGSHFFPSVDIELGVEYTISARIRGNANIVFYEITDNTNKSHFWIHRADLDETEFRRFTLTFTADANYGRLIDAYICTQWGDANTLVGDWFEIESRSVKLERGNKATDWTPAPEDTESVLSTLSDQYTSVEQTLSSVSATVASHTTEIAAKADNTKVTEVSNKVGSLELSLDQFQSSVSNTYATKTELDDVNSEVETIESRVTTTETKINQNEDSIASLVSRTEIIEGNYSTTENVNSAIEQKADSIMSSVSATYATLTELGETNTAVSNAQSSIDGLEIGGRNLLLGTSFDGEAKRYERLETYGTEGGFHFYPSEQIESGVEYVLSLSMRGNANIVFYEINTSGGNKNHAWVRRAQLSEEEFRDFYLTFTVDASRVFGNVYICTQYGEDATAVGDWFELESCSVKLERGNRKTDWTPAPEDMATNGDVDAVQLSVESAEERITTAESVIQQLSDSIMMLVTDENGATLMTQTDTGWTYNISQLQDVVNGTSESLDDLVNEVGDVNSTVGILQQAVDDLGVLAEYVKITTYEDEPCIELGENDSDFKLLITNTRILFMEGSSTPAYITNQSLHIEKAVVEEELQQGGFVWKIRSNGNLGLMWKGEID